MSTQSCCTSNQIPCKQSCDSHVTLLCVYVKATAMTSNDIK